MSEAVALALIAQMVPFLSVIVIVVVLVTMRRQLREMLDRATKIGIGGVISLEVSAEPLKEARSGGSLDQAAISKVEARLARARDVTEGARVLWVDDEPAANRPERQVLRAAGVVVLVATTTQEGLLLLDREDPVVVITDMARPESASAGLDLARVIRRRHPSPAVVGYVTDLRPGTPPEMFGITNRPDTLVHLVLDALERQ